MVPEVAQGQIWKEKGAKGTKCYVTYVKYKDDKPEQVYVLYPDGYVYSWTVEGFKHNHDYTGDHVPFEDVAAVLFCLSQIKKGKIWLTIL